ncbi:MAG TPA: glutaredoxin family protein [Actinophytocola sp.]|uniref:glutaredoxin family protein n=1 Tax=Actinophytocola sp. TaxID=1872138 RepID=UPI002DB9CCC2|nr:glutaredoxin family protein [Actinophytocola sp.]HEU5469816.1 glutaredoxin family protein [Actinophytocola sp.]
MTVTVLGRADCPACAAAEADVRRICGELGVPWTVADVDADPELRAEYGDRVPVILIDGVEHGYWAVEEDRLRAALMS